MNSMSIKTQRKLKRLTDIFGSIIGLVVFLPIMLIVYVLVRCAMGKPAIFRQERIGLNGQPFEFIKFRTMLNSLDRNGRLLPDDVRLTGLGRWLRKTSLDELPQFWKVLCGEMSIIGPRPLPIEYLPLYTETQACRHSVPQGIVGWAAVNGRNDNTWERKFELDLWYVNNWSYMLDIKILFLAIFTVLTAKGISREGHVTAPPFTGSEKRAQNE